MMERTGLRFYRVEADVGMMGGTGAHEYMAPCAAGEDEIVLRVGICRQLEVARAAWASSSCSAPTPWAASRSSF